MTPVNGALTITWINQYVGNHRVCYRKVAPAPLDPSEPCNTLTGYCCIIVNCPNPPGSSNTTVIPVLVDNDSCDDVEWQVYVQATCEDESSTTGQVFVTPNIVFNPSPTCLPQSFTCSEVPLVGFEITNEGRENANGGGYNGTESVSVGGDLSGSLIVGIGDPNDLFITNPGSGAATPGVYNNVPLTGGSGTGATATVTITAGVVSAVTSLGTAITPYAAGDTLGVDQTFAPGLLGLVGEIITVIEIDLGTVIGINYTPPPGTLYTVAPTVVIGPPTLGSAQASAVAILGNCPNGWDAGTNCNGDTLGPYQTETGLGVTFSLCYDDGLYNGIDNMNDIGFILGNPAECCFECVDYTILNNSGDTIEMSYVNCSDRLLNDYSLVNGASITLECVVNNSLGMSADWTAPGSGITVTTNTPATCAP